MAVHKEKTSKERMCCVCRERKSVSDLVRIARIDGEFVIDEKGNSNGRGCYVSKGCIPKAIKTRALNRSFKTNIRDEIYQALAKFSEEIYTK